MVIELLAVQNQRPDVVDSLCDEPNLLAVLAVKLKIRLIEPSIRLKLNHFLVLHAVVYIGNKFRMRRDIVKLHVPGNRRGERRTVYLGRICFIMLIKLHNNTPSMIKYALCELIGLL